MTARRVTDAPHVALDVTATLMPAGGIGRYVHDLVHALTTRHDAPPVRFVYPEALPGRPRPDVDARWLRPLGLGSRRLRMLLVASARMGLRPDRLYGRPAVMHSPVGHGPRLGDARLLLTIHDLTFLHHPEWHPFRTAFLLNNTVPFAARAADRILCDSEFVRGQVIQMLGVAADRVETVPLAVNPRFSPMPRQAAAARVAERFGVEGPFVLHVGTIEPRKNHAGLVTAFEGLRRAGFPGSLVLVGQEGWRVEPIVERLRTSAASEAILRVAGADDRDLVALYSACTMFVFPSLDEGFGLPPLEAMACGAPVVTSNGSSLAEIARGAADLVDPSDQGALTALLVDLWRDAPRREALAAAGLKRAARYAPEPWISRMFAIYRELLAQATG